jgi:CheY-like chemotaxis protein
VNDCINGFADMLEASLGGRIELHLSLRRGLPKAVVDPEQLEMAILNIALNARDAMPGGGVLTIATAKVHLNGDAPARGLSPGDYISVELVDEGEGMAQHVIARAVEPFFTTKATGKGTGLGLAMASGFVLQSRGRLEIESEVGKGTTVRILFPVSTSDDAELPVAGPKQSVERGEAHILLVEDDAEVRALARENLEDAGYRVTVAENGDAGLVALEHLLATDMVDLVFTDLVMPGNLDGIALAEAVRRLAPQVPVLMTTGYNEDLVVEGPLRSERDVLGKPYRRADLLDRIAQALAHRDENSARRRPSDFGAAEE